MRKIFFLLSTALLFSVTVFGQVSENQISNSENEYDYAGQKHNYYLNKVYDKISTIKSKSDLSNLIYNQIKADLKNNNDEQNSSIKNQISSCTSLNGCTPNTNEWSDNTKSLYNQLLAVFDNSCDETSEDCLLSMVSSIKNIESEITASDIEADEKSLLLITSSVGRYSLYYWFYNATGWSGEEGKGGLFYETRGSFSWKQMGKVDLQSGAGAGTVGAIAGGSVSFGTLAVPSWVVGAVGGSAGNAVGQLLGW